MTRTVDIVVVAEDAAAVAATIEAVGRGLRVLVVVRARRAGLARVIRQSLRAAQVPHRLALVMTGAELACVDGVNGIEAVVVRYVRTGRLIGFNASALLALDQRAGNPESDGRQGQP
jgi:hypothetical protein